jgi:predicted O-linked N-acetylglucosamine transferase (SPINDLY family)
MVGFFEALSQEQIEWMVYSNIFDDESDLRQRIRKSVNRFINIAPLNNEEVAQLIRSHEVDILIDLNNVTRHTRIAVLAYRPAAIQLTTVGATGSIGAEQEVDYIVLGEYAVDQLNRDGFTEHVIEGDFFAHDPIVPDYSLAQSKSEHELPDEAFVFCCFNNHYKLSPSTFAMWQEIMSQVDNSVLWLVKPSESVLPEFTLALERYGIDASRVVFAPNIPWDKHVARLKHADLVLDTLPYGAHTTSADALRAGIPVLTMPGRTWAGRVAQYYLNRCGLQEWIVDSPQAYVSKAVAFAQQSRQAIQAHKDHVFQAYWSSPLVDNAQAAQRFANLCLALVEHKRAGLPNRDYKMLDSCELQPVNYRTPA